MTLLLIGLILITTDLSETRWYLLINTVIVVLIPAVGYRCPVATNTRQQPVRDWYVLALLIALFFECIHLIPKINPNDKDHWLIAADMWLFGGATSHSPPGIHYHALADRTSPMGLCQFLFPAVLFMPQDLPEK